MADGGGFAPHVGTSNYPLFCVYSLAMLDPGVERLCCVAAVGIYRGLRGSSLTSGGWQRVGTGALLAPFVYTHALLATTEKPP